MDMQAQRYDVFLISAAHAAALQQRTMKLYCKYATLRQKNPYKSTQHVGRREAQQKLI